LHVRTTLMSRRIMSITPSHRSDVRESIPALRLSPPTAALCVRAIAFAVALLLVVSGRAHALGYQAHRVAAEIAEQFLEPATARQVRALAARAPVGAALGTRNRCQRSASGVSHKKCRALPQPFGEA
jgi:hypothetical protein